MGYIECIENAKLLLSLSAEERKALLKVLNQKRVRLICECAHNLLRGNVKSFGKSKLQKLRKHKASLRRLARRGESWIRKRRFLVQKGGGGFLLPLLLSTILQTAIGATVGR